MSNQHNYTDMIDAYLTGQLNQEDSSRLMERLEQDPALKDEFLLQQDMVQSLQAHRRNELKARLNNIEVGTGSSFAGAGALKMVAGTALVALIGTGIYFSFNNSASQEDRDITPIEITAQDISDLSSTNLPEIPEVKIQDNNISSAESKSTEELKEAPISPSVVAEKSEKSGKKALNEEAEKPASVASSVETKKASEAAEVVKPEIISFFDEQDPSANSPEADSPEDKLNAARSFNTQNIEVTTVSDNRYSFHYMFFNNQLHIYGDFSKVPYEVLEFNSGTQTRYYLYHNGLYYELNPDQRKITRLKELKNESIIKELEITRTEKLKR